MRGNITVLRKDVNGENRVLSDMTCPCVFGHMSVVDGSRRSATCRANGPVEMVTLNRSVIDLLISEGSVAGIALRRLIIASLCDQLCSANGFVRKIVQDHAEHTQTDTPDNTHSNPTQKANRSDEGDLTTLSLKLGGWEASLGDLVDIEKEIQLVMDEDQKRTMEAKKKR